MPEVAKVRTPVSVGQAQDLFAEAWRQRFGEPITAKELALLMALSDLETGTFKSIFNHNFGNQIATRDSQEFYRALDSGNPRRFRSYPDAFAGARSFVAQVTSDTRPEWKAGLLTGDPVEFARALKGLNGGPAYYEAPLERYTNTLVQRWRSYTPTLVDGEPLPPEVPPETERPKAKPRKPGLDVVLLAVGLSLAWLMASRSSAGGRAKARAS